jgi:hypothetical protein
MGNDGAQRLGVLTPVVEDRPAVQPDHVRHVLRQRRSWGINVAGEQRRGRPRNFRSSYRLSRLPVACSPRMGLFER